VLQQIRKEMKRDHDNEMYARTETKEGKTLANPLTKDYEKGCTVSSLEACVRACLCVYVYPRVFVFVYVRVCVCVCTCVYTCMHACMLTKTHARKTHAYVVSTRSQKHTRFAGEHRKQNTHRI